MPALFRSLAVAAALAGLASTPALALPDPGVALSAAERRTIAAGGVAVKLVDTPVATMKDVWAIGTVRAAPEAIWKVVTDYEKYAEIFPGILSSETQAKEGAREWHKVRLDYPWPLPDKWTLNEISHEPETRTIRWRRVAGTLKELVGSWRLLPDGKRTLVVYQVRVDPGLPLVPGWAVEFGTSKIAPSIVERVRERAEAAGR